MREPYFLKKRFQRQFERANKYTLLTFKIIHWAFNCIFTLVMFFQPALFYFAFNEAYSTPLGFELPILPAADMVSFFINWIDHFIVLFTGRCFTEIFVYFIFVVLVHCIIYLDAIQILIGNMERGIEDGSFHDWLKTVASEVRNFKE